MDNHVVEVIIRRSSSDWPFHSNVFKVRNNIRHRIRADAWECNKSEWTRTLCVLKHHQLELEKKYIGNGRSFQLSLLCGADVISSFTRTLPSGFGIGNCFPDFKFKYLMLQNSGEKLWSPAHLCEIIERFGIIVINRDLPLATVKAYKKNLETELDIAQEKLDNNIIIISEESSTTRMLSSTQIREALRKNLHIRNLVDDQVIDYICQNNLYGE